MELKSMEHSIQSTTGFKVPDVLCDLAKANTRECSACLMLRRCYLELVRCRPKLDACQFADLFCRGKDYMSAPILVFRGAA